MDFLSKLRVLAQKISETAAVVGVGALLATSIYVAIDVICRRAFGLSFVGTDELAGYAFAAIVGWGACFAFLSGGLIRVDVIYERLPASFRAWLDVLAVLSTFAFAVVLAWNAVDLGMESLTYNNVSNTPLRLPLWIPQLIWGGGFLALAISSLLTFVEVLLLALLGRHEQASLIVKAKENEEVVA